MNKETESTKWVVGRGPGRSGVLWAGPAAFLLLTGMACERGELGDDRDGFTYQEWKAIEALRPFSTPKLPNPANAWAEDLAAARLGQMIWYDTAFSSAIRVDGPTGKVGEAGKVACVTCHDPHKSFVDTRTRDPVSHGTAYTSRNSPALVNMAWYQWFTWGGRMDSLAMQGANAPEAPTDVATTRLFFAHVLYQKYRDEYNAIFPIPLDPALDPADPGAARFPAVGKPKANAMAPDGPWEMMTGEDRKIINTIMANTGKAIEAFERQLVSSGSPFERYVTQGEYGALSPAAKRGLKLYIGKAACNECHFGSIMSDNKFHNIGVPQAFGAMVPAKDSGRFQEYNVALANPFRSSGEFSDNAAYGMAKVAPLVQVNEDPAAKERLRGTFRTQALLNIADTPPYFHNGSAQTLEDVVQFYNKGGGEPGTYDGAKNPRIVPLGLSEAEVADLVEFLKHLTGGPVAAEWTSNTAKPN